MKKVVFALLLLITLSVHAQFNSGQVLTAAGLNAALSKPTITGGTISGLSASPSPFYSSGGYTLQLGPYANTWVNSVYSGNFEYLEAFSALNARGKPDSIGMFAASRTSTGSGGANAANIGVASMAYNDYAGGAAGAWGFYGTVLRGAGSTGVTHGMEIDVANFGGTTVTAHPYAINPAGLTEALRLATGGEAATGNAAGTATAALSIVRNDANATPHARFNTGVLFDANAISPSGQAIALPTSSGGNTLQWFTPAGADGGYINSTVSATANATHLNFSNLGASITGNASQLLFQVPNVASAANYVTVAAAAAGASPQIIATGSDSNVGIVLTPKGAGQVYVAGNFQVAGGVQGPLNVTGSISATAGVQLPVTTIAALPACSTGTKGMMYAVSDATAPTYNGALSGGGSVSVPVYCNGSAWTSH